ALRDLLLAGRPPVNADTGPIDESQIAGLINARRVRRMSDHVKLTLAATSVACADARIDNIPEFAGRAACILGTLHGSTGFCETYYRQIVADGVAAANPVLFAEGVPNSASAQLSLMLGIRGGCQTLIGSRLAGVDALRIAAARVQQGIWDQVFEGAAE